MQALDDLPKDLQGALVVALDDSDSAREALRFAADLAEGLGQPLHVLSVWNLVNASAPEGLAGTGSSEQEWQQAADARLADVVAQELGDRTSLQLDLLALHGNTTATLMAVSAVARHLIVGSRGRGGFTGLLLGSTSAQLVQHARCPVTVVRHGPTAD